MKLKVCGMKYNPKEVAELQPDYLGFIFWESSSRFFEGDIPELPDTIKKVGVFVDESIEKVLRKVERFELDAVQLHGNESPEYCKDLKEEFSSFRAQSRKKKIVAPKEVSTTLDLTVIKVFSIKDTFDFTVLQPYEQDCDYFLFDTKGKLPGGNGFTFDWSVLQNYPSTKPYFLSGGISLDTMDQLQSFLNSPASKYCHTVDVNSGFETKPGLKKIEPLEKFIKELINNFQLNTDDQS